MDYLGKYEQWLKIENIDKKIEEDLVSIKEDNDEIKERFHKMIEFGTAGLRGILGAGTNRMNIYTVRRAALGLAKAIKNNFKENKSIVIAYDSRHMSREFASESAKIFAENGIKAYVFKKLAPTPLLSYAVRNLKTSAGIMITASHNPKNYNGYKVYWNDGAQITEEKADMISREIKESDEYLEVVTKNEEVYIEEGKIEIIYERVFNDYYSEIAKLDYMKKGDKEIKILYSPFFGTGFEAINNSMEMHGFLGFETLELQKDPNPDFPDLEYPNPEDPKSFKALIEEGKIRKSEVLMASDPDADRIGVHIFKDGEYIPLTGNQMGVIMIDYLLNKCGVEEGAYLIKTVVTADLGKCIAEKRGLEVFEVLTGFKYIAEKAKSLKKLGRKYFFGYEESYGYMPREFVRDKDAIQACLLIGQIANDLKEDNKDIIDRLNELYEENGYFIEENISNKYEGITGMEEMMSIMSYLRTDFDAVKFGFSKVNDYKTSEEKNLLSGEIRKIDLPTSNVLKFYLDASNWVAIRPSGTEPKIKFYFSIKGDKSDSAQEKMNEFKEEFLTVIKNRK